MSFYFGARKPLGYMQDMFTQPTPTTRSGGSGGGERGAAAKEAKRQATWTYAKVQSSGKDTTERRRRGKECHGAQQKSPYPYVSQPRQPLWSRLLCEPEVYDPYIEAAPIGPGLNFDAPLSVPEHQDEDEEEEDLDACDAEEPTDSHPDKDSEVEEKGENSASLASRVGEQKKGEASLPAPATFHTSGRDSPSCHSTPRQRPLSASPPAGNVFTIFDTRACAANSLHHRLSVGAKAGRGTDTTECAGNDFAPSLSPHLAAVAQREGGLHSRACPASYFDEDTEDYEEREKGRMRSLVEKRWRQAEQRKKEVKRAREARIAVRQLALEQQMKMQLGDSQLPPPLNDGSFDVSSPMNPSPPPPPLPPPSSLTVSAVNAVAPATLRLSDLYDTVLTPQRGNGYGGIGLGRPSSPTTSSMEGSVFIDDEHADIHSCVEEVYQQRLQAANGEAPQQPALDHLGVNGAGEDGTAAPVPPIMKPFLETAAARAFPLPVKYPLGSRAYLDRVLLAQRPQQVFALMALLTESHRWAWHHYLGLIQLYYYYINPILAASPDREVSLLQWGSQSLAPYHAELRASAADYQYLKYNFDRPWHQLFLHVRHYLNIDEARDELPDSGAMDTTPPSEQPPTVPPTSFNSATTPPPPSPSSEAGGQSTATPVGTVCFAATLLHSMELFERYRLLQTALRDAKVWLCRFYQQQCGGDQSHGESASSGTAAPAIAAPVPKSPLPPSEPSGTHGTSPSTSMGKAGDLATPPPSPQSAYVPMHWLVAQDNSKRGAVYWIRRQKKLAVMTAAEKWLRTQRRQRPQQQPPTECDSSATSAAAMVDYATLDVQPSVGRPTTTPSVAPRHRREGDGKKGDEEVGSSESDDAERSLPPDTYQMVNVGCFGLSFRSPF